MVYCMLHYEIPKIGQWPSKHVIFREEIPWEISVEPSRLYLLSFPQKMVKDRKKISQKENSGNSSSGVKAFKSKAFIGTYHIRSSLFEVYRL